ncbi:MAG: hypothetical protein ACPGED_09360, partial [Flavobacteriales bacterium]
MKNLLSLFVLSLVAFAMVAQEQKGQLIEGPLSKVHQFENKAFKGEHAVIFPLSANLDTVLIAQTSDSTYQQRGFPFEIQPMLNVSGGLFGDEFTSVSGGGISARATTGKRFHFRLNAGMY